MYAIASAYQSFPNFVVFWDRRLVFVSSVIASEWMRLLDEDKDDISRAVCAAVTQAVYSNM